MENKPDPLLHNLNNKAITSKTNLPIVAGILLLAILMGVIFGYSIAFIVSKQSGLASNKTDGKQSSDSVQSAGIMDKATFKDKADGLLKAGGFEGEGSFHLERPGGVSQNVYLTSTAVDLSQFVGKKVQVYGATYKAEKAGWLMDVGYVEIMK